MFFAQQVELESGGRCETNPRFWSWKACCKEAPYTQEKMRMGKNLFKYIPLVLNLRLFNAVGGSGNVPQYRQCEKDTLTGGLSWCFSIPRAGGPTDRWFPGIRYNLPKSARKQIWSLPTVRHCAKLISDVFVWGCSTNPANHSKSACLADLNLRVPHEKLNPVLGLTPHDQETIIMTHGTPSPEPFSSHDYVSCVHWLPAGFQCGSCNKLLVALFCTMLSAIRTITVHFS